MLFNPIRKELPITAFARNSHNFQVLFDGKFIFIEWCEKLNFIFFFATNLWCYFKDVFNFLLNECCCFLNSWF